MGLFFQDYRAILLKEQPSYTVHILFLTLSLSSKHTYTSYSCNPILFGTMFSLSYSSSFLFPSLRSSKSSHLWYNCMHNNPVVYSVQFYNCFNCYHYNWAQSERQLCMITHKIQHYIRVYLTNL